MKIGIIGSRGIPNEYGGFEQFAEYLSIGLVKKGCEVWVYSPHNHSFQDSVYKGVKLIHCNNPENKLGPAGHFIYDFNCIIDSRKRGFDIILQLGYTTSAIWNWLFEKKPHIVTNLDGTEWKRSKYNPVVQQFLKFSENLVLKKSHYLVADSKVIKENITKSYGKVPFFIPYGADQFSNPKVELIRQVGVVPHQYLLMASRMQSDNHVEEIIRGANKSKANFPLILVGNINNKFARNLQQKYSSEAIRFLGGIYDQALLNNLRYYSLLYFHGHSAGGTNPSLIEAMATSTRICAHNNKFNKEVLGENALFFCDENEIAQIIDNPKVPKWWEEKCKNNLKKIESDYSKQMIIDQYFNLFNQITGKGKYQL